MAFETGTATSQEDFMTKLRDFLQLAAVNWVVDEFDTTNDWLAVHHGNAVDSIYVQWRWDNVNAIQGYHSEGFTALTKPPGHPGDSGNGDDYALAGSSNSERRLSDIGNGPYANYFFFSPNDVDVDPATDPDKVPYVHFVLEISPGRFTHGSIGLVRKKGNWSGGGYHGLMVWDADSNNVAATHNIVVDGAANGLFDLATVHFDVSATSYPGLANDAQWAIVGDRGGSNGTDTAGNARIALTWGTRDGWVADALNGMIVNPNSGFVPMAPVLLVTHQEGATDTHRFIGSIPDMRILNGTFLEATEEIVVGSDTWKVFPWAQKLPTAGANFQSGNAFIAYKKIT